MTGKPISFSDILKSFDSSMQALFDLYLSIQDSMGNKEWGELSEYYNEIFSLFPEHDQDEVQAILDRLIQIDVEDLFHLDLVVLMLQNVVTPVLFHIFEGKASRSGTLKRITPVVV